MIDTFAPTPAADAAAASEEERRDTVSILGSSLLQPIADHIDKLLLHEERDRPSHGENGYAAMLVVEFNILLESYISRLRYTWDLSHGEPQLGKRVAVEGNQSFSGLGSSPESMGKAST